MTSKVCFLLILIVAVQGSIIPQYYHAISPYVRTSIVDYDDHPQYTFSYDINDPNTGDIKNQQESRSGGVVHGQYSLVEPDGVRRTVDYASDPIHGFNAVVRRDSVVVPVTVTEPRIQDTTTTPVPTTTTQEPITEHPTPSHVSSHVNIVRTVVPQPIILAQQPQFIAAAPGHFIPNLQPISISHSPVHPYDH